jgi:polar amino acid transport system substrate-binding protein
MSARLVVLSLIALCLVSACSAPRDDRASMAIEVLDTPTTSAAPTAGAPLRLCTKNPRIAPLPEPGRMPAGSQMATILKRKYLEVGVDQNTLMLGYLDPTDNLMHGFEVEIAREIAFAIFGDRSRDRVQFKPVLTSERTDAVKDRKVDLVIDAVTMTCTRWNAVDFSTIYFMAHQRTMVRSGTAALGLHDLSGHKVCATNSSTAMTTLLQSGRYGVIPYPVRARTDCLVALQTGAVDGIQTDDAILYGFHEQDPLTKILGEPYTDEPYGIAVNKGSPGLVDFVNSVLDRMRRGDTGAAPFRSWQKLYAEFLGPVTGVKIPTPPKPTQCHGVTSCPS